MIFLNVVILLFAFVALVKGADIFVDGSAALARFFKIPSIVIGLTVVALGTSMPELAVSTSAALAGANEIVLSNVVGSNIFNLLVVLGRHSSCSCRKWNLETGFSYFSFFHNSRSAGKHRFIPF